MDVSTWGHNPAMVLFERKTQGSSFKSILMSATNDHKHWSKCAPYRTNSRGVFLTARLKE